MRRYDFLFPCVHRACHVAGHRFSQCDRALCVVSLTASGISGVVHLNAVLVSTKTSATFYALSFQHVLIFFLFSDKIEKTVFASDSSSGSYAALVIFWYAASAYKPRDNSSRSILRL